MDLFNFSTDKEQIAGHIGYFGLEEWWLSEFSESERYDIQDRYMERYQNYKSKISLAVGNLTSTDKTSVHLLQILSGLFFSGDKRSIAHRMLEKAEELIDDNLPILERHFFYSHKINAYYEDRKDEASLEKAVKACRQQIALSEEARNAFLAKEEERRKHIEEFSKKTTLPEKMKETLDTISASHKDKAPSLPVHRGYEKLAIILERQKRYQEAIDLCVRAQEQGWQGNWGKRIERCRSKLL